jgi:hypothetical protein
MRDINLTLKHSDDHSTITELRWSDGQVQVVSTLERVRGDIEKIIRDGLSEWIGDEGHLLPRTTLSSDPRFMERLAAFFNRQFDFIVELRDNNLQGRQKDTCPWPPARKGSPVRSPSPDVLVN